MRRRELIALLSSISIVRSPKLLAQQPARTVRLGLLMALAETDPEGAACVAALRRGLHDLGWREGYNLRLDVRWVAGDPHKVTGYAAELLDLAPNVAIAHGTPEVFAFKNKAPNIPIVFVQVADPVRQGVVPNLSHPGGNVTGFMGFEFTIAGKWLQLLKKAVPTLRRVAIMFNPNTAPYYRSYVGEAEAAATQLDVEIVSLPLQEPVQIEESIAKIGRDRDYGLLIIPDTFTLGHRNQLVSSTVQHRVPSIFPFRFYALSGGMISYGIDLVNLFFRAASYVDRILRGENAGSLPVEAPTKFQLIFNLKTVKSFGLTLSPELVAQADEVIE
jgi:putative tryptophan/tyrosine transport system substrate-binding protein